MEARRMAIWLKRLGRNQYGLRPKDAWRAVRATLRRPLGAAHFSARVVGRAVSTLLEPLSGAFFHNQSVFLWKEGLFSGTAADRCGRAALSGGWKSVGAYSGAPLGRPEEGSRRLEWKTFGRP